MSKKAGTEKVVELSFEGELTIPKAAELKVQLVEALENSGGVSLNLKNVTQADLTFLQLLCSAHRTAYKAGKVMMLTEVSEAVDREVIAAGFIRDNMSCGQDCSDNCLWLESE
ncbi:MAG TPA: STAS domain-containing protein [Geopsychrobacteraceae bacterium]|nr:STAS domain-containing protein [Geopsychrobacteraceae bacterium]